MARSPDPKETQPTGPDGDVPAFEDAMGEIESIIESIESGELGLEASIKAYERAADLMRGCRGQLRSAELRVEEISGLMNQGEDESETD